MNSYPRRALIAALIGAAAVIPAAAAATAAPAVDHTAPGTAAVTVGRLVLEPTARGYGADLPITITNNGRSPVDRVRLTEPVPGSWRGPLNDEFCQVVAPIQYQRTIECFVTVEPGQSYTLGGRFEVPTRTRPYAMTAGRGQVTVHGDDLSAPALGTASFRTAFRSTTGSLRHPRPYVQDRTTDASITAGEARLTRQPDGSYAGWVPVTIRYRGDAPHTTVSISATVPGGVHIDATDPESGPVFDTGFDVPGGRFMQGERRTFRLRLTAPAGTAPGPLDPATLRVNFTYENTEMADRRPADNTVTFPVSVVDGS